MKRFFWLLTWLLILVGIGVLLNLRTYRVFTQEELVAIVQCGPSLKQTPLQFVVGYTPVFRGAKGPMERFQMIGEQWSIGGDILKWHPWVNLLGLKNAHKLTRLSSRYLKAEDEIHQPRSAYDLNGGADLLWRCLHRFGAWLPFVEAVYGNTAYAFARPGTPWGVYVTSSGYLIKPLRTQAGQRG